MNAARPFLRRLDDSGVPLLLARLILAVTFLYMGSHKIAAPVEFLKLIRAYQMLPETPPISLNSLAIVLPWMEVVAGTALLVGIRVRGAAAMIAVMLAVFTPAILIRALAIRAETGKSFFEIAFDCGCGSGPVIIWTKLLGNVALFAVALLAMLSRSRRFLFPQSGFRDASRPHGVHLQRCDAEARQSPRAVPPGV